MAFAIKRKPINGEVNYCVTPASILDSDRHENISGEFIPLVRIASSPRRQPSTHDTITSSPDENNPKGPRIASPISIQQQQVHGSSNPKISEAENSARHVSWGINWKKAIFIWTLLFSGLILSLGHHMYYLSLNGTLAGDAAKQAWPIRFGTAFAFLVTACLQAVTATAIGQYFWRIVRVESLSVAGLDKLFSITSDPSGLASTELVKTAKLAILMAAVFWCLGFAGVAPPATLTVTPKNLTVEVAVPAFDFSKPAWFAAPQDWQPQSVINRLAIESAYSMNVVPFPPPVASEYWSYDLSFVGPTMQCHEANGTEKAIFDAFTSMFEEQDSVFIYSQVYDDYWTKSLAAGNLTRLLYSGLAPYLPVRTPGSWLPNCSSGRNCNWQNLTGIWVQTSTNSIVCNFYNATFDITVASIGGAQDITQNNITVIGSYPIFEMLQEISTIAHVSTNVTSNKTTVEWSPWFSHSYALGGLLTGNISLSGTVFRNEGGPPIYASDDEYSKNDATTNLLATGLIACSEIQGSPFASMTISPNLTDPVQTFSNTFPSQPWMCRNSSLVQAIEDLANNITISLLSSPDLTSDDAELRNITTWNTVLVYQYNPMYLLISYGIGLLLATLCAIVGLWSLYSNGVSHATGFSSIMATTRNMELDKLTNGESLGAEPLHTGIKKRKLRFGPLLDRAGSMHIAFGFEESVGLIEKGGLYT